MFSSFVLVFIIFISFILSVFAGHVSVVGNRGPFDGSGDEAHEKAADAALDLLNKLHEGR